MFHISLLGRFHLQLPNDTDIYSFESGKIEHLFCYLLCNRKRPHNREVLASLLWQGTTARTRRYLRKTLWQLQNAVQPSGLQREEPLVIVESEWVYINLAAECWLDIAVLEDCYKELRNVSGKDLTSEQADHIRSSLTVYRGDLLENCFQDWCLRERERMRYSYLSLLDKMMRYCETHAAYEEGIGYGELILGQDNARENTHRSLMRLYYLAQKRTDAIRQYQKCAAALREELDVNPSYRTEILYKQILEEQWLEVDDHEPSSKSLADQLWQLRGSLASVQSQLDRAIEGLDLARP